MTPVVGSKLDQLYDHWVETTQSEAFMGKPALSKEEFEQALQDYQNGKASEQWTAQLTVLRELINHHVKEEESTGFSCARSEFDKEQLEKMGQQFQRQKEKLMAEA